MKKLLTTILLIGAVSAFGQTAKAKSKKTAAAKPLATEATAIVIPKEAVLGDDGSYHYTDKQGKKWLYRSTPFGVSRVEDKAVAAAPASQPAMPAPEAKELTTAQIAGDTVKFERPSLFGTTRWEKKMGELTDDEKKILESQKSKQQ